MEKIRCVIAGIPQIILADIIQQITEKRSDIEVVCRIKDVKDLLTIVKDHVIDVVILGAEAMSMSELLNEVFEVSPQLVAIGVVDNGRRICVCAEDIGLDNFIALVKVAVKKDTVIGNVLL